ncbi:hypothetical protein LJPFL01_3459 [Lelliottia jeotgali]|nr:hypothetical protein LJPFL01_3459 [Lelliottia jeotgali]
MNEVVVISDNQYFLIGFSAIHPADKVVNLLNPDQTNIKDMSFHRAEAVFVFISDIEMHREICKKLQGYTGAVRFFFRFSRDLIGYDRVFWDSRMPLKTCHLKLSKIYRSRFNLVGYTPRKKHCPLLIMMSQGINVYIEWLQRCNFDAKKTHSSHRKLLRSIGYSSVNIHNLFHSEYLAPSIRVISKIKDNSSQYVY